MLIFYDNLDGERTGTDTDSLDHHRHVLFDRHLAIAVTVVLSIDAEELGTREQRLTNQQFTGLVDIAQISQGGNTHLAKAVVVERTVGKLVIVVLMVVFAIEIDMDTTVGHVFMAFIYHYLMAKRRAAYFLVGVRTAESIDQHVVFLRHNHEAHAFLPVAHAVETEVLTHKIGGFLLAAAVGSIVFLCNGFRFRLLDTLRLHDIGILLSHGCQSHDYNHSSHQNHSFHDDIFYY